MTRRPAILIAALLATLAATWWAASLEEAAAPVERSAPAAGTGAARIATPAAAPAGEVPTGNVPAAGRARWPDAAVGLFEPYSFRPELASAPPPAAAAPAEVLPPLPFRFVGALEDRGQRSVILLEADTVHILRAGERVDARYRVERITPTEIVFTYLPARQRQTLDLSAHDPSH